MNKKALKLCAPIIAASVFIGSFYGFGTFAQSESGVNTQEESETEIGYRTIDSNDFEDTKTGSLPKGFGVYKSSTGTASVQPLDDGSGQAVCISSKTKSDNPTLYYSRKDYTGKMCLEFSLMFNDVSDFSQTMIKDLTSNKFFMLMKQSGNNITFLDSIKGAPLEANVWYNLKFVMDSEENTIEGFIGTDELESVGKVNAALDFTNLAFRVQPVKNNATDSEYCVWFDNFSLKTYGKPQITLNGDETIILSAGTQYVEPGYSATDIVDGDITDKVEVTGEVNTNIPGTYILEYNAAAADGTAADTVSRTVIVKEKNLFNNVKITASEEQEEYPVSNINDGDYKTFWKSSQSESTLIADMEKITVIDKLIMSCEYENISSAAVSISDDGKNWANISSKLSKNGSEVTIEFEPCAARYVKTDIVSSDNTMPVSIAELECYASNESVVELDALLIDVGAVEGVITKNLILKNKGTYGSDIVWKSSNTNVISDTGIMKSVQSTSQAYLTATLTYINAQKEVVFGPFVVQRKAGASSGGSGGSGGSSGGSGGSKGGSSGGGVKVINVGNASSSAAATPSATASPTTTPLPSASASPVPSEKKVYGDINNDYWAAEYIKSLKEKKIISDADNFYPERSVTRAEFLKMLMLKLEIPYDKTESGFTDVNNEAWYAPFVCSAAEAGIINGISDDYFGAQMPITRQDAATVILRAAGYETAQKSDITFADDKEIADYARDAVYKLAAEGVIDGNSDGGFNPTGDLTRAQCAKLISLIKK